MGIDVNVSVNNIEKSATITAIIGSKKAFGQIKLSFDASAGRIDLKSLTKDILMSTESLDTFLWAFLSTNRLDRYISRSREIIIDLNIAQKKAKVTALGNSSLFFGSVEVNLKFSQPTIYIDKNGQEKEIYMDYVPYGTTEIKQIGYIVKNWNEAVAIRMPQTIKVFPKELPREITSLYGMFSQTKDFDQDLSTWDVSNVTDMTSMFYGTQNFNGNISGWDVSNVTTMQSMFEKSENFNQDLSKWNTANVKNMYAMFYRAFNFNQDISSWDVSNVENMENMFRNAEKFNQDLSGWHVKEAKLHGGFDIETSAWEQTKKPKFN